MTRLNILRFLLLIYGGVMCSTDISAQNDTSFWKSPEYLISSNAWLKSYNAAGLSALPVQKISTAELYFRGKNGKFINYYESDNNYDFGAKTESFYRINPRVVLYGQINYNNFKGKNMGGSVFIDPYYNAFDIIEYSDSTKGSKNLERYHLTGAVSINFYKGIILGGRFDYKVANYAKHKDPRHKNNLLDMSVTAGLSYRINRFCNLGINYLYRRTVEGITLNTYGNTDREYRYLIDFGAFWGHSESGGESGYTETGNERPVFNEFNGISLQAVFALSNKISLFNEFTLQSRDGYYGERSPSSVVFTEHNSDIWEYMGVIDYNYNSNTQHRLDVNIRKESLENNENVYREESLPGGNKNIIYYGNSKVLERDDFNLDIGYTGNFKVKGYQPEWVFKLGGKYQSGHQKASIYPYFRKQSINRYDFSLSGEKNLIRERNMYTFSVSGHYGCANGTEKEDGKYANSSENIPKNLDYMLYQEYEYLTASRIKTDIQFKYSKNIRENLTGYTKITYHFTKAFKIQHLKGDLLHHFALALGCQF